MANPIHNTFRVIHRIEEIILSASMMAMAALTIGNVLRRMFLGSSYKPAEELSQFLIIIICFVGLSYAVGKGRHIRMTAIYDLFPDKGRKFLMLLIATTTAMLMFVLSWYAYSYAIGVNSTSPVLGVEMKYIYLVAPLGLLLAGIQYVLVVVQNLRKPDVYLSFEKTDEYEDETIDV